MYFDAGKHLTDEGIALYVDALKLNCVDQVPREIREHVSGCRQCKQAILELESLVEDHQYSRIRSHPTFGKVRTELKHLAVYRIAASLLLIIGLGVAAKLLGLFDDGGQLERHLPSAESVSQGVQPETTVAIGKGETSGSVNRGGELAENFIPSPTLESVVGSTLRSEEIVVTSPAVGETSRGVVSFRWDTDIKPAFTLKILNNREGEEVAVTVRASNYVMRGGLSSGLYYWKLEARGDLLYVGKFFVKRE